MLAKEFSKLHSHKPQPQETALILETCQKFQGSQGHPHIRPAGYKVRILMTILRFDNSLERLTTDSDCSHEIKRCLLLGRKAITNLDSILKSRDITFINKGRYNQSYGFSFGLVLHPNLEVFLLSIPTQYFLGLIIYFARVLSVLVAAFLFGC